MKKILAFLCSCLALSICSCSSKTQVDDKKVNIDNVTFNYTYSKISFDFKKDVNAKSYNAYFSQDGSQRAFLQDVLPKKEYDFNFLADGDYTVKFKGFALPGYEDSGMKIIGEVHHFKLEKDVDDISLSAYATENYSIKIDISNKKENDKTPITVKVKKGSNTVKIFEHISESSELETEAELPAGNYKITAFFEETEDSKKSYEAISDSEIEIPTRKSLITDFNAELVNDEILLTWEQYGENLNKKLTVKKSDGTEEIFINSLNNLQIKSGIKIPANFFKSSNLTFYLQLVSDQYEETFLTSDISSASINFTLTHLENPGFTPSYSSTTGDLTITCNNAFSGNCLLEVFTVAGNQLKYSKTVNSLDFPFTINTANKVIGPGNYEISLKKIATNGLEVESNPTRIPVAISAIDISPCVDFVTRTNPSSITVSVLMDSAYSHFGCDANNWKIKTTLLDSNNVAQEEHIVGNGETYTYNLSNGLTKGYYRVSAELSDETKAILGDKGFNFKTSFSQTSEVTVSDESTYTEVNSLFSTFVLNKRELKSDGWHYDFVFNICGTITKILNHGI